MPFATNEYFTGPAVTGPGLGFFPACVQTRTFAIGDNARGHSGTLVPGTPLGRNAAGDFVRWVGIDNTYNLGESGNLTAGTFTLTLNGETTAPIAFDATAATIQAALEALTTPVPGDVAVTGGPSGTANIVIKLIGANYIFAANTLTSDSTGLTGGVNTINQTPLASIPEAQLAGIVWPDPVVLDVTNQVLGEVMLTGRFLNSDITIPAGQQTLWNTHAAAKARVLQLTVEGLAGVH